ncbi:sugar kinase [Kiloniella antarctica]|uniref:Sugar kinase n=1 Tax=Kiloniella antarctica TaxID=1550907 RepID=A0ABW5BGV9_9PROT
MISIGIIGECMIELSRAEGYAAELDLYKKRYGGDTYNTAYYLAQCSKMNIDQNITVNYITALGDDDVSNHMITTFSKAGVKTDLIEQVPKAVPGLYAIQTDDQGERSFLYWRSEAPVRKLFQTEGAEQLKSSLLKQDWLYFSGITLAVLYPEGRHQLFELCKKFRAKGGKVAFDINYRPRLWDSTKIAQEVINQAYDVCDLALPSYDDEKLLFDVTTPSQAIDRILSYGAEEIVLKNGSDSITVYSYGVSQEISVSPAKEVKDTTSAGDSFNAGYIYARLMNKPVTAATDIGRQLASQVIGKIGAIVPVTSITL